MSRIFLNGFNRAKFQALWLVVVPHTFGAQVRVNDINFGAHADGFVRADRFTDIAVNAFFGNFQHSDGKPGYFAQELAVYGREGQPCPACQTDIKQIRQSQRSSYYCPVCQR